MKPRVISEEIKDTHPIVYLALHMLWFRVFAEGDHKVTVWSEGDMNQGTLVLHVRNGAGEERAFPQEEAVELKFGHYPIGLSDRNKWLRVIINSLNTLND